MDQKRILWIVAASGVFLLVVVGVALFLSAPAQTQPSLNTLQTSGNTWIKGEVKNPTVNDSATIDETESINPKDENKTQNTEKLAENQTITVDTVTLIAGTTNVYTQQDKDTSEKKEQETSDKVATITVNTVSKTSSNSARETVKPTSSSSVAKPTEVCEETPVSTTSKSTVKTTATASTAPAITQSQPIPDQYWVQVASFTGKKNAEDARAALLEEKINSEIFTYKDSKGTVYYRLRVGPYTTKSEAEYWHSRIKLIEQFAGTSSYVVNSTGKAQN